MSWPHDAAATEVNQTPYTTFSDEEYLQVVMLPILVLLHPPTPFGLNVAAQIIISREIHPDLDGIYSNYICEHF